MTNEEKRVLRTAARQEALRAVERLSRGGCRWLGSRADLLEIVRAAYTAGYEAADGRRPAFAELSAEVLRSVGEAPCANPYAVARRAEERKGVRSEPVMARLTRVMSRSDTAAETFWNMLIISAV